MLKRIGKASLFLMAGMIFGLIGTATGATYYISQSGGDDGWSGLSPEWNGTDGPKQTLLAVQTIMHDAGPGTQVLLKRGDTWTTPAGSRGISLTGAQGTHAEPVVLGTYGTGNRPVLDVATDSTVIYVRGSNDENRSAYIIIQGLHLTTSLPPGSRPGLGIGFVETYHDYGPHHITVRDCVVENLAYGVQAIGLSHDITIEDCIIRNNFGLPPESGHTQGLYSNINGLILKNSLFECNGKNERCGAEEDSWFDHNIYLSNCRDCLVENNTFRHALDAVKIRRGNNIIIRGNTIYDMNLMGLTAGADADQELNNTLIENNQIYDTSLGIAIKDQSSGAGYINNMILRNNIVRDPKVGPTYGVGGSYCFLTASHANGIHIYNNLFSGLNARIGFSINDNPKSDVVLKNNIFLGHDASRVLLNLPADLSQIALDNNLYYDTAGGDIINWNGSGYNLVDDFSSTAGKEPNGVQGDPVLNPNYSLSAASTHAIDAGADPAGYVTHDLAGISRPQGAAWDIGPYEYVAGTPTNQCSDGIDNDADGQTDYPDDTGCADLTDNDESTCTGADCHGQSAPSPGDENSQGQGSAGGCFLSIMG